MSEEKEFAAAGRRIRALRGETTQSAFAERLGVNRKTVERWEAGERLPDGQSLLALMTVCGADVNYILTGQRSQAAAPPSALPPRVRALVQNYEATDEEGRRHIERAADLEAQSAAAGRKKTARGGQ
ncbi:helix-turn-helix domain-containing protein [Oryzisolibacter propanilivorax]|uniref:helix-turn-helix domain-containing protein n=1 Tax=Oryzisolibacter propanilivorax TaxID=1527607 RepID=UPI000B80D218|nr:helix-turn-helix transcriptional regulator [Oryzisolibacter propanilivorax]